MSYLSGITNIHSLGTLNPYTSTKIRGNSQVVERILKQAAELQGLGDTEGKKIPFSRFRWLATYFRKNKRNTL